MFAKREKVHQKSPLVFLGICVGSYCKLVDQEFREGQPKTVEFQKHCRGINLEMLLDYFSIICMNLIFGI